MTSVTGRDPFRRYLSVREGGVEPPRPCGHWNLNPARLPIPPPAHWVCPPAPALSARRLPTPRTLARWRGSVHIPFPRGPRPRPGNPLPTSDVPRALGSRPGPSRAPAPPTTTHGSDPVTEHRTPDTPHPTPNSGHRTSVTPTPPRPRAAPPRRPQRLKACLFTYQPRTGPAHLSRRRRGPQPGAGHWSAAASTIHGGSTTAECSEEYVKEYARKVFEGAVRRETRRRRHPSTGPMGGTSRFSGAWIRSVSSTR